MDDSLPSSIGEPIAESTFLHRDEAPDLQISVPLEEMYTTNDDLQPPVLERSVPLPTDAHGPQPLEDSEQYMQPPVLERSAPLTNDTGDDDDDYDPPMLQENEQYMQPPVLERSAPLTNDTGDDDDDYDPPMLQENNDTVMPNETYVVSRDDSEPNLSSSFDISHRDVDDTPPIQEQPVEEEPMLTDTIVEDLPLQFTVVDKGSQRGRQLLVDSHGYSYGIKTRYTSSITWRCSVRTSTIKCPVTVKQSGDRFAASNAQHIHPADLGRRLKAEVSAKVKQDAVGNVFRPAMDIVDDAMLDFVSPNDVVLPKKPLLKRVANRFRAKKRPQEPRNFDFEVDQDFLQCDDFLIGDIRVGDFRHFLFATEKQLSLLRAAKRWYMDGTFKVLSDPWKRQGQLFSIHAFIEKDGQSQQFPLAFCIMSRKTIADYNEVFRVLMVKLGRVEVEGFVVDFEAAAWRALRDSFPGKPIKGCVFHWNQAVWRHVQQIGLSATYQQREGMYDYIRQLMALPFLPARHIQQTFDHLKTKANTEQLQRLVDYIDRQWFHHPVFDVPSWCVFQQTVRTNNDVEGWHHRLNSKAGMSGLGFYRLVPLLQREATLMEMALRASDLQRDTRGTYRRLETRLEEYWAKYMDHEMSTTAFLRACGSLYGVRPTAPVPGVDE